MRNCSVFFIFLLVTVLFACSSDNVVERQPSSGKLFTLVSNEQTGIKFRNSVEETSEFNVLNYYYAYNGGGVAIGDVNNDGLMDIYFTSNQQSNKLYLNKGSFEFEDITDAAGVSDSEGWSTGANMIDINNDGWMDIYVCKSASVDNENLRHNRLYVNQQDGTFREEASRWGLDDNGFSVQSHFFDYDRDGDLDMFLVNHRHDFYNSDNLENLLNDDHFFSETSDHLFRNDGTQFTDVTMDSGLKNKEFSLSASIGDFNSDGWPDIFVANDFITPDKLYINQKNGTFMNQINIRMNHTSFSSMGSDFADINNDFLPDLIVLDMSAEDHRRGKQNMASMNTAGFWKMVNAGYHYSYMSNILNLNNGNGSFTDIAQISGISKTDWSWAPLIADFNNDGLKDILVTNGIKRELANQDFGVLLDKSEDSVKTLPIDQILGNMPSEELQNYVFRNNGDLSFAKVTSEWGLEEQVNSNGAAYADLDNDGDLDLVLNNLEHEASIYRNNTGGNFIAISLKGSDRNVNAVGAVVKVYTDSSAQWQELMLSRGYQSSVSPVLNFGIGGATEVSRIEVIWPNGMQSEHRDVRANQVLVLHQDDASGKAGNMKVEPGAFERVRPGSIGISFRHTENDFNDFSRQVLLPQQQSREGPAFEIADVNGDGLTDMYIGGALGQSGIMYVQGEGGTYAESAQPAFVGTGRYEDNGAHFFDADNDGDLDLYVASGGFELGEGSELLQDRIYLNDGAGVYLESDVLPQISSNTKAVISVDYDDDGDADLFVGGHAIPGKYPLPARSYLLENRNGRFVDVTGEVIPELSEIGIINDLSVADMDADGDLDILVAGEWMNLTLLLNNGGSFTISEVESNDGTSGWWNTIAPIDFDNDGDTDFFAGNLGVNNKFHPRPDKPLHIYGYNFDDDGLYDMILSKKYNENLVPVRGKECSTQQNPFVSVRIPTYHEFANSTLSDIYGAEMLAEAYHRQVVGFETVYVENKGNGEFEIHKLPVYAQAGPTMSFAFADVNSDGHTDVIGVGAIHEAEVETVRYDGNIGYVILGDSRGGMDNFRDINFYNDQNARKVKLLTLNNDPYVFIANNDSQLSVFRLK